MMCVAPKRRRKENGGEGGMMCGGVGEGVKVQLLLQCKR